MPPLQANVEGCRGQRRSYSRDNISPGPQGAHPNTTGISTQGRRGEDAANQEPQHYERNGREGRQCRPDPIRNDGIQKSVPTPREARYSSAAKPEQEVSTIGIQTETCDTVYVSKDTLVAYMIAIVQNTQTLQFDQMQVALQTAQTHASIETPLKAEQLMTAHFNLALLTDETVSDTIVDAPPGEAGISASEPPTPADAEETICKALHPNSQANKHDRNTQPTSAVVPTYRADSGPVRGILTGYESDNSWDFSDGGEADCSHVPRTTTLLHPGEAVPTADGNKTTEEETTVPLGAAAHPILDRGTTSRMAEEPAARKHSARELTINGNIDTNYRNLLTRSASLDLEVAFKRIKISQTIKPDMCEDCQEEKCKCPAFTPETPCSSVSLTPTKDNSDQDEIPDLVPEVALHKLYPPVLSPSDEEANREVAAICSTPIYYWVKSKMTKRHRYYTYDALDYIAEQHITKRQRYSPSQLQGYPLEH